MRKVFILGCERSGSTWLSNIVDAHPQTELFMEPFAEYACLFENFPGRNTYIDDDNPGLVQVIKEGYQHLPSIKYPFFYRPGRSPSCFGIDRSIARQCMRVRRMLKMKALLKLDQYMLLNLNTCETPVSRLTRKSEHPSFCVTKELRLNFKIPLLAKTFPAAIYIVIIRHPGAQISSILKYFDRGNLGELSRWLDSYLETLQETSRFKDYQSLIKTLPEHFLLPLWWLINYETLIEDLQKRKLNYKIICHEELSATPHSVITDLFQFCGLTFDDAVKDYIEWSTSENTSSNSPVDTARHSKTYYKEVIERVDPELNEHIRKLIVQASKIKVLDPAVSGYLKKWYKL